MSETLADIETVRDIIWQLDRCVSPRSPSQVFSDWVRLNHVALTLDLPYVRAGRDRSKQPEPAADHRALWAEMNEYYKPAAFGAFALALGHLKYAISEGQLDTLTAVHDRYLGTGIMSPAMIEKIAQVNDLLERIDILDKELRDKREQAKEADNGE